MTNSHDLPLIKSHYTKEILYINTNSHRKRDTNRFIFSLACDIDFEKFYFFLVELKFLINNF